MSNFPIIMSHSVNASIQIPLSLSQDKTSFQNSEDIMLDGFCCAVSRQKVQLGGGGGGGGN